MTGLGEAVAELISRARAGASALGDAGGDLRAVSSFGSNPGALRMWLHVPEALPQNSPLVVVLHGCGQSAAGYAAGAGWLTLADRYGFAVLCPEQVRSNNANLCFNWFEDSDTQRSSGEAASIAQMVRQAVTELNLDRDRVFVSGLSAGGAMAAVMLATYPEVFAAGAIIAGLPYGSASGVSQALGAMRRVPVLSGKAWGDKVRAAAPPRKSWPKVGIWYGDADTTVTPTAAQALALQWTNVHGATGSPVAVTRGSGHTHFTWLRPEGSIGVELHKIAGIGHGTPIAANGEDGCGTPAPWILEAGVSSSLEIARSWSLVQSKSSSASHQSTSEPASRERRASATHSASLKSDVGETIARALRGAGLMR